ncbi:hypothetical protein SDC9_185289 [bioreactor metagenome]|uniref:Uncharacterized protein n=1 Tax=bioreactor metagenome TaxID=1076179 RepID=A0A645HFG3_9ZZZZ
MKLATALARRLATSVPLKSMDRLVVVMGAAMNAKGRQRLSMDVKVSALKRLHQRRISAIHMRCAHPEKRLSISAKLRSQQRRSFVDSGAPHIAFTTRHHVDHTTSLDPLTRPARLRRQRMHARPRIAR